MTLNHRNGAAGLFAAALAMTGGAAVADTELPGTMVWTAYDLGSSGYDEASGIANALMKRYETRVRIVPSGTSIGRMLPITTSQDAYDERKSIRLKSSQQTDTRLES